MPPLRLSVGNASVVAPFPAGTLTIEYNEGGEGEESVGEMMRLQRLGALMEPV